MPLELDQGCIPGEQHNLKWLLDCLIAPGSENEEKEPANVY